MAKRLLWTLREGRHLDGRTWDTFKTTVLGSGRSPDAALARLIRRYLDRGFDDGQSEGRTADQQ